MAECKACGSPIIWAKTANAKAVPLDAGCEKRFIFDEQTVRLVDTYSSHFVSCPDAAKHRKKGKAE